MNRHTILTRLAEADARIRNAEARIVVLADALGALSGEALMHASVELRGAGDALIAMRQYQSALLEELALDDAE